MTDLETSVTIKYKAGHDATWAVFKGGVDQIKSQMMRYFGIPEDVASGMSGHQLAQYATDIAQGKRTAPTTVDMGKGSWSEQGSSATTEPTMDEAVANVQQQLGGEVVSDTAGGSVWDNPAPSAPAEPAGPDHSSLIAALNEAPTTDALTKLWATNKAAFDDKAVVAAYKARGKALK